MALEEAFLPNHLDLQLSDGDTCKEAGWRSRPILNWGWAALRYQRNVPEPPREKSFCFHDFLDNGSPTHLQCLILTTCLQLLAETFVYGSQSIPAREDCTESSLKNRETWVQRSKATCLGLQSTAALSK